MRVRLNASPFVGPEYYRGWLEEFGQKYDPFVVAVENAGRLVAIASWARRGPLVMSVSGRAGIAGELLASEENAAEVWLEVLKASLPRGVPRLIVVPHAPSEPSGLEGALFAAQTLGLHAAAWPRFVRHRLRLVGDTLDAHLARWDPKRRQYLRRSERRLDEMGSVTIRRVSASEGYATVCSLHLRQWSADESIHAIHSQAGQRLDRRLYASCPSEVLLLEVDDRPVAAGLWLDSGGLRVFQYLVRDTTITHVSPGELLHYHVVRLAFEDDMLALDTMGAGGNKQRLGIPAQTGYEVAIGRGASGRALIAARATQLKVKAFRSSS